MPQMLRTIARLALLCAFFGMLGLNASATAADDNYGASVVTSVTLSVDPEVCHGQPTRVTATVSSDVSRLASRVGVPEGSLRFSLDGSLLATRRVDDSGSATLRIAAKDLTLGTHTVLVEFVPDDASAYQASRATATIKVIDCGGSQGGPGDDDGILPNAGGPWLGLLAIALLMLIAGATLVARNRRAAAAHGSHRV